MPSIKKVSARTVPPASRVYAIGDIHGSLGALKKIHQLIFKEEMKRGALPRTVLIYLGDYIDRGPDSKAVLDYLLDNPVQGMESIFIQGNHERFMLEFLSNPKKGKSWLNWGADSTFKSYGINFEEEVEKATNVTELSKKLAEKIPLRHVEFCRNMKSYHVEGDYIFVHAGLMPGLKLEEQDEEVMMMIRNEFFESDYDFGKNIVFGHTIFPKPFNKNGRIGIDTGAYATDMLTCVVLEKNKVRFLQS